MKGMVTQTSKNQRNMAETCILTWILFVVVVVVVVNDHDPCRGHDIGLDFDHHVELVFVVLGF